MAVPSHGFELPLACPLDGLPVGLDGSSLACGKGHRFDIAKEGYANLLPVQLKSSRDPGDSKEMVRARRLVLDSGAFDHIADGIAEAAAEEVGEPHGSCDVLDAGCGEGFYLDRICRLLNDRGIAARGAGVDISKWAVRSAAKKYRDLGWLVGTNRCLPVQKGAFSLITCIFGFPVWPHWADMLDSGRHVLVVDPARDHLKELREVIYDEVRYHDAPPLEAADEAGFDLVDSRTVSARSHLGSQEVISNLISMTPHAHRMTSQGAAALAAMAAADVTIAVEIRKLRKR